MTRRAESPPPASFYNQIRERHEQAAAHKRTTGVSAATSIQPPKRLKASETPDHIPGEDLVKRLATQAMEIVVGAPTWSRRQVATACGGLLAIAIICLVSAVIAVQAPSAVTPTAVLPVVTAQQITDYLLSVGVPLSNVQIGDPESDVWAVDDGVRFDVAREGATGTFVILAYRSPDRAGADAFRIGVDRRYQGWRLTHINTLLVLASPETPPLFNTEITSHVTSYLITPYRGFVPTASPRPTSIGQ